MDASKLKTTLDGKAGCRRSMKELGTIHIPGVLLKNPRTWLTE
jgi:hypothetical protein